MKHPNVPVPVPSPAHRLVPACFPVAGWLSQSQGRIAPCHAWGVMRQTPSPVRCFAAYYLCIVGKMEGNRSWRFSHGRTKRGPCHARRPVKRDGHSSARRLRGPPSLAFARSRRKPRKRKCAMSRNHISIAQ